MKIQKYSLHQEEKNKIYTLFLSLIISLTIFLNSCMTTSSLPPNFKNQKQAELYNHAKTFIGTPYQLGGLNRVGMDCSGLVVRIYKDMYNISLPHSTTELYESGNTISIGALDIGDLVFFRENKGRRPTHIGIYMGKGNFIHASTSKGVIQSKLKEKYYRIRYVGARRMNIR